MSASIGVSVSPSDPPEAADDLLSAADIAMYTAKRQGCGRALLFREAMRATVRGKLYLAADLVRAAAVSPAARASLASVVFYAHQLGLGTTAGGGVATAAQLDTVAAAGCDWVIGPVYGPAQPTPQRAAAQVHGARATAVDHAGRGRTGIPRS